jgi:NADPH:quinone reductase-like Zn-dependent oxidoreductase
MRALRAYAKNDPAQLVDEEAPAPQLGSGDVLVRVHASGVAPTELAWPSTWLTADGASRPLPIVPGHEVSGVVEAIGPDAGGLAIGDEVFGLIDFQRDGADADYVASRAVELAPKPATLDHVRTAAVPLSALTAWQALFDHARLERGQRVLIHGAAGGVGSFAVQLARWRGARVVATASAKNADKVRSLGADEVLDYRTTRFDEVLRDLDAVFDPVGGETWERSWRALRPGGVLVSIAVPRPPDESRADSVRAVWFVVAPNRAELIEIARLIDEGHVMPIVERVLPLARGREAFDVGLRDHGFGKTVLDVAEGSRT